MPKLIFEHADYKAYLREAIRAKGRGEKSRVAEAARCHLAYISQVLNAEAQLSLEQADLLNDYFGHSDDEAEFFLLLVSRDRAGSASLRGRYAAKVKQVLADRIKLDNRLRNQKTLPVESQATYYSAWYYSAIHLLITIPEFQSKEKLALHLGLPIAQVSRVLEFLVSTGLASLKDGRYGTGQVRFHLQNDSPWITRHHASWRVHAAHEIEQQNPANFHYTSIVSMSEDDAVQVRKELIEAIEKVRTIVRASPEKRAYCYALDLFGV